MWFRRRNKQIEFDEILLDASNLPAFNQARLEGRMELPISTRSLRLVGLLFCIIALLFLGKLYQLQVVNGTVFAQISRENQVDEDVIIAERGVVYDRLGEMVAWNEHDYSDTYGFPVRAYTNRAGLGQLVGYVSYPAKDKYGFYFRTEYLGRNGVEEAYNDRLAGENGHRLVETDATGQIVTEHAIAQPTPGQAVELSVDAGLSEAMYNIIATSTAQSGSRSGAGAIMDIHTGELLAITSFPSYDPEVMADGDDEELIDSYNADERFPFLNKVVGGTYTPGSIVKPFVAYAALAEGVIDSDTTIVSNGQIVVPNRYNPDNPSIFRDWRIHGKMTMHEAIAFSSNVYFYTIGGGFEDQPGLGITKMHRYFSRFGIGSTTGVALNNEQAGIVPNPAWKQEVFADDWRVGDTYYTAIGQYGFVVTPIQMLRAYAALANGGTLVQPHTALGKTGTKIELFLNPTHLDVVRAGMRAAVTIDGGTARPLERADVAIAAKSGTAELDSSKSRLNTWVAGFWPYEEPQYAFIMLLENAPYENSLGGTRVMADVFDWMSEHRPEYLLLDEAPATPTHEE